MTTNGALSSTPAGALPLAKTSTGSGRKKPDV
jgi:hypothetical protein